MNDDKKQPMKRPERVLTDDSLDAERERTDRELAEANAALQDDAEAVIHQARERADEVVKDAREWADDKGEADARRAAQVARVRKAEDAAVRSERAAADSALLGEDDARRKALAALLEVERQHTDLHLRTERQRADAALEARDEFLAVVTHDLRTLLGGVAIEAALLTALADRVPSADTLRQRAATVERYVGRMSRLVDDLVDVASIEAGKLRVLPEPADAAHVFTEAVDAFRPLALSRGIALEAEMAAGPLPARLDHHRVLQVLSNLVSNALRFTGHGGRITLRAEPQGRFVRFTVADSGCGIAPDQMPLIFDRFHQGPRYERSGLGLGLFISRRIVEAHGGQIVCNSTEGVGSTFSFTVPAAPGGDAAPA